MSAAYWIHFAPYDPRRSRSHLELSAVPLNRPRRLTHRTWRSAVGGTLQRARVSEMSAGRLPTGLPTVGNTPGEVWDCEPNCRNLLSALLETNRRRSGLYGTRCAFGTDEKGSAQDEKCFKGLSNCGHLFWVGRFAYCFRTGFPAQAAASGWGSTRANVITAATRRSGSPDRAVSGSSGR